jgi:predicted metal-dependent TIM-barrel fold hydrolase
MDLSQSTVAKRNFEWCNNKPVAADQVVIAHRNKDLLDDDDMYICIE